MKLKPIVVMGNGPSLKGVDFSIFNGFDTFGMNGAYRFYRSTNWWPTYFGCFDDAVTKHHQEDFKKMIEDDTVPIKMFFLRHKISESPKLKVLFNNSGTIGQFSDKFETFGYGGNTGVNCCQASVCMGYNKIILIGVDCNYVERVEGSQQVGNKLVMAETLVDNPNYWLPGYQQKGDIYNPAKANVFHKPAWESFARFCRQHKILVVNCSPISTLNCFAKASLESQLR